jgi:predicted nucleic acid-binding Zn ribbon protein
MPIYTYEVILTGEQLEILHPMAQASLKEDERGRPIRKVFTAPNITSKYTERSAAVSTSNENLGRLGFTKYSREGKGTYRKEVGAGPDTIKA